jgi:hypothetical protein
MADNSKPSVTRYQKSSFTSLADLAQNPTQVALLRASAGHPDVVSGVRQEEEAKAALENLHNVNRKVETAGRKEGASAFTRGSIVRHKPTGRKVTIIRASAAKDGGSLYEVVDAKNGKRFLAREDNLNELR